MAAARLVSRSYHKGEWLIFFKLPLVRDGHLSSFSAYMLVDFVSGVIIVLNILYFGMMAPKSLMVIGLGAAVDAGYVL